MSSAETPPASSKTIPDVSEERLTEIEPGACAESMLVTTDSFEEFANEMSSSLEKKNILSGISSTINEIQGGIQELDVNSDKKDQSENNAELHRAASEASLQSSDRLSTPDGGSQSAPVEEESVNGDDCLHDPEWMTKKKHIFILSSAGKPIYSRYGNEDKLAGLCGIIQALVSVVHDSNQDTLRCIRAGACSVVFLVRGPLILATACQTRESDTQLILQLTYVFNQIVSVLTLTQLTRIFEQRRNYDLRRLLSGVERLIDHLVNFMEKDAAFLMGAVRCLPLAPTMRDNITSAIISACSKIKDLVFAILMAGNQLITLVRMKKYTLHPSDIHLLFNLVRSSESFKTAESWTPICLPKFDPSGFLHGHVSYLSDDCQACLVLLTVQRDAFHPLSQAKHTITEKLRRTNCLEAINEAVSQSKTLPTTKPLRHIGVPEMRHFIYKCLSTAQLFTSDTPDFPSHKPQKAEDSGSTTSQDNVPSAAGAKIMSNRVGDGKESALKMPDVDYLDNYRQVCSQLHCTARPVNLIYRVNTNNAILAWVSPGFELYVTFDPLVEKNTAIAAVDKLLRWIKKEEDRIFIMKAPTF